MPCLVRRIAACPPSAAAAGEPVVTEAQSLEEAAREEHEGGVYAAFVTRAGRRVVGLGAHYNRLADSARRTGFALRIDRELVGRQLRAMMDEAGYEEARVRIYAYPGETTLTAAIEPYAGPPPELLQNGVACRTAAASAREHPLAKQTAWLADRRRLFTVPDGEERPYEWLLLDRRGAILEGSSSNFYAVLCGRRAVRTAAEGMLEGITRSVLLAAAGDPPDPIPVDLEPVLLAEVPELCEAFLTSSSRDVVPVTTIDGRLLGTGMPGEITRRLAAKYEERAVRMAESL